MRLFEWFWKHVRKIGLFGVEVEFHPPSDAVIHRPAASPPTTSPVDHQHSGAGLSEKEGKTFQEVIQAIRKLHPHAPLGRTAEQGEYYERAKGLANYRMYEDNPVCYAAAQPNGKVMWLYLGRGGKICCGDKE